VALTYDQASGVGTIYCNGAVVVRQNLGSFTPLTTYNLYLGRRPPGGSDTYTFAGLLDEPSLYNRALSSNEIAAIYNADSGGKCPPPPTPPLITTQPANQVVTVGGTASFSVTASGTLPLSYQWNFDGTNLVGATNIVLTLVNVQLSQAGNYTVLVTNSYGSILSSNATLTVLAPPIILVQPTNQTVVGGGAASFSVTASGTLPLSYQWSFNTTNLVGETNATLRLTNVQFSQAGNYLVQIANTCGSILSSNATLTVNDKLDHFAWGQIPSPRFVNVPFAVVIQAMDVTNGIFTNFTGAAFLVSTEGVPINPAVSGNFALGVWTGTITVAQIATNLVLQASDGFGESGLANPINIVNLPSLTTIPSGGTLDIFWPVNPTGFVLETTAGLSPANWAPVTTPPFQIGDQYLVPIQMSGTNAFYRLRFSGP